MKKFLIALIALLVVAFIVSTADARCRSCARGSCGPVRALLGGPGPDPHHWPNPFNPIPWIPNPYNPTPYYPPQPQPVNPTPPPAGYEWVLDPSGHWQLIPLPHASAPVLGGRLFPHRHHLFR